MTEFVRVRSVEGPTHEYSISTDELAANPDLYDVVDNTPTTTASPATYPDFTEVEEPVKPRRRSSSKKPKAADAPADGAPQNIDGSAVEQTVGDDPNKENIS